MYIYIHLVQYSSGIEVKFTAKTKQLCNVFVTACARAVTPSPHDGCKPSAINVLTWDQSPVLTCNINLVHFYMLVCIVFALNLCLYIP